MNITRTFDLLTYYENEFPNNVALADKRNGEWITYSAAEYRRLTDLFSCGLLALGLQKGDKIATVSNNRSQWNIADMGMSQVGMVHVPIYPTISETEYRHILSHSEAKMLILATPELYYRIYPWASEIENVKHIYTFDAIGGAKNFDEIIALGEKNYAIYITQVRELSQSILANELCTIIYTSGTTGLSKGVMLSHHNFISNVHATKHLLPFVVGDRVLSFLPLCHVLERMVNYLYHIVGVSIYYAESIETVGENLKEVKPAGFATVPRLLEKTYDKILNKGRALTGIKKQLFFGAIKIANKFEIEEPGSFFYRLQLKLYNKLIFSKWREALGGNIKGIIVGGAALQPRLARVFWAAQIPVHEGYGLTETAPVIAVNDNKLPYIKFGTVGKIIEGVEVKIAEDGEILFKGPNLMLGYFKDPEKTAEAIDAEGWFHTGDIGEILPHNLLRITDRKKEMFKLSTGKYVAPQVVENRFKESEFIEQLMVVGENQKFAAAVIVPNFDHLKSWCNLHEINVQTRHEMITNPLVYERIKREVEEINATCNKTRQLKKFALVTDSWTTDTGELSPTLKLKRKFVAAKYQKIIDDFYAENDSED